MRLIRSAVISVVLAVLASACSDDPDVSTGGVVPATVPVSGVPDEVRVAVGTGQPRSPGYWQLWSSCGPDSRAATAEVNGGAEAGWFIVDDFLGPPAPEIADVPIDSCDRALAILTSGGEPSFDGLAAQLLAAELSRTSGAETCDVAGQAQLAAHQMLRQRGYAGPGSISVPLDPDAATVLDLLATYATGDLCV